MNLEMDSMTPLCIYPLSPTYLPFHRYLYYLAVAISVLYSTPPPIIKGAFAYALTYSATASLYVILLISQTPSPVLNLDVSGIWSILSPACTLLLPLLSWNKNLSSSSGKSARTIVRIWGVWVTIRLICNPVLMVRARRSARQYDPSSLGVESCSELAQVVKMNFRLRDAKTAETGEYEHIFSHAYNTLINIAPILTFIPLLFGFIACLNTIDPARPKTEGDAWTGVCVSSPEGTFSAWSGLTAGYLETQRLFLLASPAFFIANVVLNEKYLLAGCIPEVEEMYEVGQWGLLAGLGLVSTAAVVNWICGKAFRERVEGTENAEGPIECSV